MKKKHVLKILLISLPFIALATTMAVALKITKDNQSQELNLKFALKENVIEGDIKYLAFGDSLSAGFNSQLDKDYPGKLEADGTISGLSFPAYIAQYLQTLSTKRFTSFDNLARSGSTLSEWNSLFSLALPSWQKHFPNSEAIAAFQKLFLEKLKNANLVTISLGANDLLASVLKESTLLKLIQGNFGDTDFLQKQFNFIRQDLSNKIRALVNNILSINKDVRINFISYPPPFLRLQNAFSDLLSMNGERKINPINTLLSLLNRTLKSASDSFKSNYVNYINAYDKRWWENNSAFASKALFDIHPTEHGYKKMAQDIILKLITNKQMENFSLDTLRSINGNLTWDDNYFKSDLFSVGQQIKIAENDSLNEQYRSVLNVANSNAPNILVREKRIRFYEDKFNFNNLQKRFFDNNSDSNFERFIGGFFLSQIEKFLEANLNNSAKLTIPNQDLLLKAILKHKLIPSLLVKIQNLVDQKYTHELNKQISLTNLKSAFRNALLDKKILFKFMQSFFSDNRTFIDPLFRTKLAQALSNFIISNLSTLETSLEFREEQLGQKFMMLKKFLKKLPQAKAALVKFIEFLLVNISSYVIESSDLYDILIRFFSDSLTLNKFLESVLANQSETLKKEFRALFLN